MPMFLAETTTSILDTSVVTFVTDAMKDVIGMLTTPPLGVFITIGLVGAIVGLGIRLMHAVKRS